jgi:hypothetical protein
MVLVALRRGLYTIVVELAFCFITHGNVRNKLWQTTVLILYTDGNT